MGNVINFDIGTKLFYKDLEYQVKGYPSFDEVLLKREIEPFNEKIVKVQELIKEPKNLKVENKSLVETDEKDFEKALSRYKIIEPLLELEKRTAKDVQKVAKKNKRGIATLYRWLSIFEQYGTVSSLSTKREFCGAKGKSRLDESINTIIDNVIEELYLNKQQYPLQTIYEQIVYKCKNLDLKSTSKKYYTK